MRCYASAIFLKAKEEGGFFFCFCFIFSCLDKSFYSFYFIPYYSKPFNFLILQIILFHFIFFNFLNPCTISLNLKHLYYFEIRKVKPFNIIFFKIILNYFQIIFFIPKNKMRRAKWFVQTQLCFRHNEGVCTLYII